MNLMKKERKKERYMVLLKNAKIFSILPNLRLQGSEQLTDYSVYHFTVREMLLYAAEGICISGLFAYVFFRSWIAFILLLPIAVVFMKRKQIQCCKKRKQAIALQFKELMGSIIAGLHAGYSIENAFINGYKDMSLLFGKQSLIVKELAHIIRNLRNNRNIEELLYEFGKRSQVDDIRDFSEIFRIAKRSGGDLTGMIQQTSQIISEKIEVGCRIDTIISSKRMEQSIMNMVPFGIILYIDFSSPGFFDILYHNFTGNIIMTVMTVLYFVSFFLAEKITDISV